jgi:hypothetical protein
MSLSSFARPALSIDFQRCRIEFGLLQNKAEMLDEKFLRNWVLPVHYGVAIGSDEFERHKFIGDLDKHIDMLNSVIYRLEFINSQDIKYNFERKEFAIRIHLSKKFSSFSTHKFVEGNHTFQGSLEVSLSARDFISSGIPRPLDTSFFQQKMLIGNMEEAREWKEINTTNGWLELQFNCIFKFDRIGALKHCGVYYRPSIRFEGYKGEAQLSGCLLGMKVVNMKNNVDWI